MLLFTTMRNTRDHYARSKFCIMQLITRVDLDLSSYDVIELPEEQKACDLLRCEKHCHRSDFLAQGKSL